MNSNEFNLELIRPSLVATANEHLQSPAMNLSQEFRGSLSYSSLQNYCNSSPLEGFQAWKGHALASQLDFGQNLSTPNYNFVFPKSFRDKIDLLVCPWSLSCYRTQRLVQVLKQQNCLCEVSLIKCCVSSMADVIGHGIMNFDKWTCNFLDDVGFFVTF